MNNAPERFLLDADPVEALQRVTRMTRVMQLFRHGGAAHERIGQLDEVITDGGQVICRGACHDARIAISTLHSVVADWSGRMRDMALPRLQFRDSAGANIFSIISLDGLEPFNAALAGLPVGAPLEPELKEIAARDGVPEDDAGFLPFVTAIARDVPVEILMAGDGWSQRWEGSVEAAKAGMGFINIIKPEFHLHLQAGAVASWRKSGEAADAVYAAVDATGRPTGLRVRGDLGDLTSGASIAAAAQ